MPLFVALDEYEAAVRLIATHAKLGLVGGPAQADAALRAILAACERVDDTVAEVLSHPNAVSQVCALSGR